MLKDFPLLASKSGAFFLGIVFEGEKNPICTAWKAQSAKNARAANKCPIFVEMEEDGGEWPVV